MTNIQPRLWNRNGKYYVRAAVPRKLISLVKKYEIRYTVKYEVVETYDDLMKVVGK